LKGTTTMLEQTAKRASVSYKVTRKGMNDGIPFSFDFADVVLTEDDDLEIDGDEPRLFLDGRNHGSEQITVRIGLRSWIIQAGDPFVFFPATQGSVCVAIAA